MPGEISRPRSLMEGSLFWLMSPEGESIVAGVRCEVHRGEWQGDKCQAWCSKSKAAGRVKPAPRDMLPLARSHLLNLPQNSTNWKPGAQMPEPMQDILI